MRALVMGKRASVLRDLADALSARGHDVETIAGSADVDSIAGGSRFDIVAFGRAVSDVDRRRAMDRVRSRNPRAQRVDGLAPITELLVAQCEWAGRRSLDETDGDPVVLIEAVPLPRVIVRRLADGVDAADVEVTRHKLTPWFSGKSEPMDVERDGTDVVADFYRQPRASRDFVSVRVRGESVFVGDSLGRLPLCQ